MAFKHIFQHFWRPTRGPLAYFKNSVKKKKKKLLVNAKSLQECQNKFCHG